MDAVFVIGKNGERLMPTHRLGHVRHLLRDGKAHIYSRNPFTIQMDVETTSYVQPMEIDVDAGYEHIGISVKSERREYAARSMTFLKMRNSVTMIAANTEEHAATACVTENPAGTTAKRRKRKAG